jgi:hypothetical protein
MKEEVSTMISFFVEAMLKQHENYQCFVDKVTIGYLPLQKSDLSWRLFLFLDGFTVIQS